MVIWDGKAFTQVLSVKVTSSTEVPMLRISAGSQQKSMKLTPSHVVYTSKGIQTAKSLQVGDEVIVDGKFEGIHRIEETKGTPVEIRTSSMSNCVNGLRIKDYNLNVDFE
jgi:hypothetical protein